MNRVWDRECRWVRPRLPLLAGGELIGTDRRRVEQHLVTCPSCRHNLDAHHAALAVLRLVGAVAPVRSNAPSLWPALRRQLREDRRPAALRLRPGLWNWPALGLGMAAALLVVVGLGGVIYHAGSVSTPNRLIVRQPLPKADPAPIVVPPAPLPPDDTELTPETIVAVAEEIAPSPPEPSATDAGGSR